ncbi:hypothetical protein R6Q59_005141 [Mikania micrantha]
MFCWAHRNALTGFSSHVKMVQNGEDCDVELIVCGVCFSRKSSSGLLCLRGADTGRDMDQALPMSSCLFPTNIRPPLSPSLGGFSFQIVADQRRLRPPPRPPPPSSTTATATVAFVPASIGRNPRSAITASIASLPRPKP